MQTDTPAVGQTVTMPETKVRTVRVDDALWLAAQTKARRDRTTLAAVLKRALVEYVAGEDWDRDG